MILNWFLWFRVVLFGFWGSWWFLIIVVGSWWSLVVLCVFLVLDGSAGFVIVLVGSW